MVRETCHHKLPLGVAGGGVDVGDVGAGGKVADVEVGGGFFSCLCEYFLYFCTIKKC